MRNKVNNLSNIVQLIGGVKIICQQVDKTKKENRGDYSVVRVMNLEDSAQQQAELRCHV